MFNLNQTFMSCHSGVKINKLIRLIGWVLNNNFYHPTIGKWFSSPQNFIGALQMGIFCSSQWCWRAGQAWAAHRPTGSWLAHVTWAVWGWALALWATGWGCWAVARWCLEGRRPRGGNRTWGRATLIYLSGRVLLYKSHLEHCKYNGEKQ